MANVLQLMPELEGDEMAFVQGLIKDMNDDQAQLFAMAYRLRRRDPLTVLLTALLGFLGIAGIHRFILGQVGMGLLYLLTAGICLIGTIIDLVNYRKLAFEYNHMVAQQIAIMIRGSS